MLTMVKKRSGGGKRGRPAGRKPTAVIYGRVAPELGAAFDELVRRTRRTVTAELTIALEEYLSRNGLWPPTDSDPAD